MYSKVVPPIQLQQPQPLLPMSNQPLVATASETKPEGVEYAKQGAIGQKTFPFRSFKFGPFLWFMAVFAVAFYTILLRIVGELFRSTQSQIDGNAPPQFSVEEAYTQQGRAHIRRLRPEGRG
jgi:hypothetical protein